MQIYLHHYIWYIFSSATIPIINFLGSVQSENEHTFFVYSIRTRVREHMFVFTQPHMVVTSHPLSNCRSCEKAAFRELQRSCNCIFTGGEGAAFYFRFRKAAFSSIFVQLQPKFDKKNQIFLKSCDKK